LPLGQLVFHSDFTLPPDHRLLQAVVAERDEINEKLSLSPTSEPIHVYLFRDAARYEHFVHDRFPFIPDRRAFFLETDTELVVFAHWNDRVAEDLRHEVAHGYLHAAVPNLPLWLDEGLAEYFEVPRGHGGLNRPHVELLCQLIKEQDWTPNLRRLEGFTDVAELSQRDYAESWAWVHFMLETSAARRVLLQSYLAEMRREGVSEPFSARLMAADAAPEKLLLEYVRFQRRSSL
jgi:hypothetical protein